MRTFTFQQSTPAATWTVTHNLKAYPASEVLVLNNGVMTPILPQSVEYVNDNTIRIVFSVPRQGSVRLIGSDIWQGKTLPVSSDPPITDPTFRTEAPKEMTKTASSDVLFMQMSGEAGSLNFVDQAGGVVTVIGEATLSPDGLLNTAGSGLAVTSNFDLEGDYKLQARVKRTAPTVGTVMGNYRWKSGYRGGSMIQIDSDGTLVYHVVSGESLRSNPGAVPVDEWHVVEVRRTGDVYVMFVDSKAVGSKTISKFSPVDNTNSAGEGTFDNAGDFHIGYYPSDNTAALAFKGYISEVKITK